MIYDKKGMVLIESLLLFMIVCILACMLLGAAQGSVAMERLKDKGLHNDIIRQIQE